MSYQVRFDYAVLEDSTLRFRHTALSNEDHIYIKIDSTTGPLGRAEWWKRTCSRKDIKLLGVWPKGADSGHRTAGWSEAVVKSRDCIALESRLITHMTRLAFRLTIVFRTGTSRATGSC
jgi:hypothetical protein